MSKAENIKFSEMLDEYSEKITDLPTTYIQIKEKKIKDYFGAPKKLKTTVNPIKTLTPRFITRALEKIKTN